MFRNKIVDKIDALTRTINELCLSQQARFDEELRKIKKEHQEEIRNLARFSEQSMLDRFGVHADLVSSQVEIIDLDGTIVLRRKSLGFHSKEVALSSIHHQIRLSADSPNWRQKPQLVEGGADNGIYHTALQHDPTHDGPGDYNFDIHITPPLQNGNSISYEYESIITGGASMSKESAERAAGDNPLRNESISLSPDFPARALNIKIIFPEHYKFKAHAIVYSGNSHNVHSAETLRASNSLQSTARAAEFTLNNPLLNFRYLIYWEAPTDAELEILRKNLAQPGNR